MYLYLSTLDIFIYVQRFTLTLCCCEGAPNSSVFSAQTPETRASPPMSKLAGFRWNSIRIWRTGAEPAPSPVSVVDAPSPPAVLEVAAVASRPFS